MKKLLLVLCIALAACTGGGGEANAAATVPNATVLAAIDDHLLVQGTTLYVTSVGDTFQWSPGHTVTPSPLYVVYGPTGQWQRLGIPNPVFLQAAIFSIDPTNGDDENTCWGLTVSAADASPCQTLAEVDRRLSGNPGYRTPVSFRILGDVPTSDARVMKNILQAASGGYPIFYGPLGTPVTTGTMSGYATKVPASNTIYQMALTNAASYIGKIVVDVDDTYAFVLGALSTNVAAVSVPMYNQHPLSGTLADCNVYEPGNFTNGKAFGVYDLRKLPVHPYTPDVMDGCVVRLWVGHNIGGTIFDNANLGGSNPYYLSTRIEGSNGGNGTSGSWVGGFADFSGDLFSNNGSGGVSFIGTHSIFHCPAILSARVSFQNSSGVRFQEEAIIYGAGASVFLDETSALGAVDPSTPRLQLGIFNTTTSAFSGGRVRLPATSSQTIYGSGNSNFLFTVPQGQQWALPKTGTTWTTSAAHPLSVGGTQKDITDVPFVNTTNAAAVTDGY